MGALSQSEDVGHGWGLCPRPGTGAQGLQGLGGGVVVVSTKLDFVKTSEFS